MSPFVNSAKCSFFTFIIVWCNVKMRDFVPPLTLVCVATMMIGLGFQEISLSCSPFGIFFSKCCLSWGMSCRLQGYFSSRFSHRRDCFSCSYSTLDIFHFQYLFIFHYFCLYFLLVHIYFMHISGCISYDMWKYLYLFPAPNFAVWHTDYWFGCFQSLFRGLKYRQAEVNFISKIYERAYLLDYCNWLLRDWTDFCFTGGN